MDDITEPDSGLPPRFSFLGEIAAPPPVENRDEAQFYRSTSLEHSISRRQEDEAHRGRRMSHGSLERAQSGQSQRSRRQSEGFNADLSELAAPLPIDLPVEDGSPGSSGSPLAGSTSQNKVSEFATKLYTISYLILFSLLGTLARLGLQALTTYPGAPVSTGVLWANFGGSLVIGFLLEDRRIFSEEWGSGNTKQEKEVGTNGTLQRVDTATRRTRHKGVKKTIPLYIGLTTGFCGSFTSFSSFVRDVFLALSNSAPTPTKTPILPRPGGDSFLALLASLIITPSLSLAALRFGAHLALSMERFTPILPFVFTRKVLDRVVVPIACLSWLAAIILAIIPPDRLEGSTANHTSWSQETWRGDVLFALVFAPLGCLARFYVSIYLNGRIASFPLGTFVVNIAGTMLLGIFYDLQHAPLSAGTIGGGRVGCQVLQGLMDGFCGCLTTVSTWVAELNGLRRRHSYTYGVLSVGIALASLIVIMGSLRWTLGFSATACGVS